jgi:MFS family permease
MTGPAAAAVPGAGDSLWSPGRRVLTIGLILTITLVAFEALAISTIMPIVARDLAGLELYGWVFSSFLLASLVGIAAVGGLIDRVGLVRPFVGGLMLFGLGLVVGGAAPSMPILVAGRFIQGLGAGAIPPIAYVAIGRSMPDRLRPQMFAMLATAWVIPGVIGPVIAATVAERLHWRLVFLGLLPIIAVAGALTVLPLLRVPSVPAAAPRPAGGTGAAGSPPLRRLPRAVVMTAATGVLLAGLSASEIFLVVPLAVVGFTVAAWAFRSLSPPGTLRLGRGLPAAILLRGALTFSFFAADTYVPLALQGWRGISAEMTSVALTAATLAWTAGAWLQARRINRLGPAWFVRLAFLVVTAGVAGTTTMLIPAVPIPVGIIALGIAALGMGLGYSALSLIVLREAPPGEEGVPTSALQLADVLGTTLGTGLGGALVAAGVRAGEPGWVGLAGAFGISIVVGTLGLAGTTRLFTPATGPITAEVVSESA